jgi:hypothetical protein
MKTLALLLIGLVSTAQHKMIKSKPVSKGELLEFRLSYGWFTLGKAEMKTADNFEKRNGKECIKVDITGKTAGLLGAFSKVDDKWGAVVDRNTFLPYYSYRDLQEGNYRLDEKVYFDYDSMRVRADYFDVKNNVPKPSKHFDIEKEYTLDMIGGLMLTRSLDYRGMAKGDTIKVDAFFDKEFYDFSLLYMGIENVKTKVGKINCHKIVPVMPDNKLFNGENSVTLWISADANRLPLKVEADMFFGTAYCELVSYKNVKSGNDFE